MRTIRLLAMLFLCGAAVAQENSIDRARQLAVAGQRHEALQILEQRIASTPSDLDAQTLYGIILSWERDFERARRALQWVLLHQPENHDARLALIRVELWSGHPERAQLLIRDSLALFPNDSDLLSLVAQARRNRETSEATFGATYDHFHDSDAWREAEINVKRNLRFGAAVLRGAHARRFGLDDDQIELELYPRLGSRGYAYFDAGYSPHARLYPRSRFGAELFQGFGPGLEASIGYRRLNFANAANIYTASFSKYLGDWLFTLRGYRSAPTNSLQLLVRRYLGSADDYVGVRLGKGATRDEIRSATDIEVLDSVDAAAEARFAIGGPWSVQIRGGAGRQRLATRHQRHTTATVLPGIRF
jgi:YaiO family outer membrane protein